MKIRKNRGDAALVDGVWQDRDVLFDLDTKLLRLTNGETVVERVDNVEDVKGNNGDRGVLRITNLRLIWHAVAAPRINLSIGYKTISGITTKVARSKIRGQVESLYIMSKGQTTTKFEFVFTCINPTNSKLFSTVIGIHRAYETSKLYRDMKMRSALINDNEKLKLLPSEYQCEKFEGVWNLSSDQGNLGVLILTNIRVVWYASLNLFYNVSIPFLQLRNCRVRDSRFGHALVLETSVQSGEYVLGFRVDPADRLEVVCRSIQALHSTFQAAPIFGVQYVKEQNHSFLANQQTADIDAENEVEGEEKATRIDAFAAYFTEGAAPRGGGGGAGGGESGAEEGADAPAVVYSEELGVAIQRLRRGFTIADLWQINVD